MAAEDSSKKVESALVMFDYIGETTTKNAGVTTFSWILKNFDAMMKYKIPTQSSKLPLLFDPSVQCSISYKFSDSYLEPSVTFFTGSQPERKFEVDFYILNPDMHSRPLFMHFSLRTQYLVTGSLIVGCDISSQEFSTTFRSTTLGIPKSELCNDFLSLFNDKSFSDVTIISKGKKFPAHRAILVARSQVFSAMLHNDMVEKKTNTVKIGDADPEVVLELLRFIYTDNVMNIEKFSIKLLELADRFDLTRLKMMCANELVKSISVSSSLEILIIADRHEIGDLKELALNLIKNRLGEIVALAGYDTFRKNYPDLMDEILRNMV